MAFYSIRTLPKGVKLTGPVALSDLTEEVLVTNSENIAKSCVDGSKKPMRAITESSTPDFDNLDRVNGIIEKKNRTAAQSAWVKAGIEADRLVHIGRRPAKQAKQPERVRKPGPGKGRFDHVKPVRTDEVPKKQEVIVERV